MSTVSATPRRRSTTSPLDLRGRSAVQRLLYPALMIGAAWGVALTIVSVGFTTTDDGHPFQHAADYWLTGLGLPLMLSSLVVVHAIHGRAAGRDGGRGRWGAMLFVVPAAVFIAIFIDGLVFGENSSWGPTYLLCVLASDITLGVLVAGLWRTGVLPRWVLMLWWLGWFVGGPLAPGAAPLLHTVAYIVLALQLRRTVGNAPPARFGRRLR
ncbi:MAG: hypothetical protein ACRDV3_15250 [Acidothermaceae bacterium]